MDDTSPQDPFRLSRIKTICVQFDTACRRGQEPTVEEYLKRVEEPDREALKRQLLAIQAKHGRRAGPSITRDAFIRRLVRSGLMPAEEVQTFFDQRGPDREPQTAQDLARAMCREGMLTAYQARCVYQGKTKGLVLDVYVVLDKIGEGGMGQVYRARHKTMGRVVAIKTLPEGAVKSDEAVGRFRREIKAIARLSHPNIVTAHDAGQAEGRHFLVMQYVEGEDLSTLVHKQGPLPVRRAIEYVLQAARGLEYAHAKGVVHRDVKPSNLLLDNEGAIRVLDLGLARLTEPLGPHDGTEPGSLTSTGQTMGTIDFMSPEQAEDPRAADERSDVYSLGCTLFFLLTGRPVYAGDFLVKLLAHREAPIPLLRAERRDVPRELDGVFQRMVAKTPDDRYGSMGDVIAELERLLSDQPGPVGKTTDHRGGRSVLGPSPEDRDGGGEKGVEQPLPVVVPVAATPRGRGQTSRKQRILMGVAAGGVAAVLLGLGLTLTLKKSHVALEGAVDEAHSERTPSAQREIAGSQHPKRESQEVALPSPGVSEAPQPAVAPFTSEEAKDHQRRWAAYLGVSVEVENSIGMKLVLIPPGEFLMGASAEEIEEVRERSKSVPDLAPESVEWFLDGISPQHRVILTRPFYMGIHEVTVGQYRRFADETGYVTEAARTGRGKWQAPGHAQNEDHPVVQITWNDVAAFLDWLSKKEGKTYRLPTDAEREYTCRAGTTTRFYFGNDEAALSDYEWWGANSGGAPHPVGEKLPNAWGLYDMLGNIREWCSDYYSVTYYQRSPLRDPTGPDSPDPDAGRVLRLGSYGDELAPELWCCMRDVAGVPRAWRGFRAVCEIGAAE